MALFDIRSSRASFIVNMLESVVRQAANTSISINTPFVFKSSRISNVDLFEIHKKSRRVQ
jgi:hypothetical protein